MNGKSGRVKREWDRRGWKKRKGGMIFWVGLSAGGPESALKREERKTKKIINSLVALNHATMSFTGPPPLAAAAAVNKLKEIKKNQSMPLYPSPFLP
jgi:hypothetical protein